MISCTNNSQLRQKIHLNVSIYDICFLLLIFLIRFSFVCFILSFFLFFLSFVFISFFFFRFSSFLPILYVTSLWFHFFSFLKKKKSSLFIYFHSPKSNNKLLFNFSFFYYYLFIQWFIHLFCYTPPQGKSLLGSHLVFWFKLARKINACV